MYVIINNIHLDLCSTSGSVAAPNPGKKALWKKDLVEIRPCGKKDLWKKGLVILGNLEKGLV